MIWDLSFVGRIERLNHLLTKKFMTDFFEEYNAAFENLLSNN